MTEAAATPVDPTLEVKHELEQIRLQREELKKELESQAQQRADDLKKIEEKTAAEELLSQKIKDLEKETARLKSQASVAPTPASPDEKLKEQVLKLQQELKAVKKKPDLQADLQRLKDQLEKEKTKAVAIEQDQLKAKELEKINKELAEKQKSLEAKLEEMQKEAKNQAQFMIVILKWSSEKHDLDLTVTDPSGKVFNFKNRKFARHSGEFTLDSRSGPGAEIWQSDKVLAGTYTVTWKLYNTYGNDKPVVFSGFISSNRSRVPILEGAFQAQSGKLQTVKIQADAKGNLTKL
jgi:hypothetical protein